MRIDKFFSDCGIFSRSEINKVLKARRVMVDNQIITRPDFKIEEKLNKVELDGKEIVYQKFIYCMFYKPAGYITATEDKKEHTIYELLPNYFIRKKVMPIGRLDKDTLGLLILTNDGDFCHKVTSPKFNVEKEYYFELADEISKENVAFIEKGITLKDGQETKPCIINMANAKQGKIIITEGKYHQVKRMFGAVGNKIVFLKRIREGNLKLPDELKIGEYIFLNKENIEQII